MSLEGYQDKRLELRSVISGAVAGNILLGGLPGWGVDAITGAQYRIDPEIVHLDLHPLSVLPPVASVATTEKEAVANK